jgi:Ras family
MQQQLLQMFDTPGEIPDRSRRHANEQNDHEQQRHRQALLSAFAQRMDGVLLVYDMTSTTSFVQLRQWHAQWRKNQNQQSSHGNSNANYHQPILIVGNKRDLMTPTKNRANNHNGNNGHVILAHRPTIPQRDVMGLAGSFTGKDFRYEYRVDHQVPLPLEPSKSTGSANSLPSHHPPANRRHHQISTFSSTTDAGILWTQNQDGTYLDSLLTTEDTSNPDRDMVKLWCLRNGLQHVEVSCWEDEQQGNVDTAMETLVRLVLEARQQRQQQQQQQHTEQQQQTPNETTATTIPVRDPSNATSSYSYSSYSGPNERLDLLERYRPKDNKCCFCFPPIRLRFRFR